MNLIPEVEGDVSIRSSPERFLQAFRQRVIAGLLAGRPHVFWGFIWPWLLISMHTRPLQALVTRLIAEVDAEAAVVSGLK